MGIWSGDSHDGYWYNHHQAIGHQLYPTGIHKYFDMYSARGIMKYLWELTMSILFAPWIFCEILTQLSWKGLDKAFYLLPIVDWYTMFFKI